MRVLLTVWNERIAPLFDAAGTGRVYRTGPGGWQEEEEFALPASPPAKVLALLDRRIEGLVCGAISESMLEFCRHCGIRVEASVTGTVGEVLVAAEAGHLEHCRFIPGRCWGRRNAGRGMGKGQGYARKRRNRPDGPGNESRNR